MRVVCAPRDHNIFSDEIDSLSVNLYGRREDILWASAGASVRDIIQARKFKPAPRAWDFLSIALSVIAADTGLRRDQSPDGWTREIDLTVALNDSAFWTAIEPTLKEMLQFLTTDIWHLEFLDSGFLPTPPKRPAFPHNDCIALLSGGLDSLIGALDLVGDKKTPLFVSQVSQGDKQTQRYFATQIGSPNSHLQLNHNADCPGANERSQRARSLIFLAYAVLAATATKAHHDGQRVPLYICENGFISINPPLTPLRFGSLSTRTTHPVYLRIFQQILDSAGLNIQVINPYQFRTKGEMLVGCTNQEFLRNFGHMSTSCGRYARNGYKHCGRCLPCLIRRAAFRAWGYADNTEYVFVDLSKDDQRHSRYDDVRAAAMAVANVEQDGVRRWAGHALNSHLIGAATEPYFDVVERGILEVGGLLSDIGVK